MSMKVEIDHDDAMAIHMYLVSMAQGWKQIISQMHPESKECKDMKQSVENLQPLIIRLHTQILNSKIKNRANNVWAN